MKHTFTCESKRDINILTEEWKDDYEKRHEGLIVQIIDVTFKHLTIGLIQVVITYEA